jgi:hypothetical protein
MTTIYDNRPCSPPTPEELKEFSLNILPEIRQAVIGHFGQDRGEVILLDWMIEYVSRFLVPDWGEEARAHYVLTRLNEQFRGEQQMREVAYGENRENSHRYVSLWTAFDEDIENAKDREYSRPMTKKETKELEDQLAKVSLRVLLMVKEP